ncbi:MAG: TrkA C-terminal domain-containing protein [Phycisphaerales bacterium]
MGPILALLVIACVSVLIVRFGAVALTMTGVDQQTARFQALSAFFGVGFTTTEAELVVDHPVRRRIIAHLIIAGNIGITSGLGTLVITFVREDETLDAHPLLRFGLIALVLFTGMVLANLGPALRPLDALVRLTLRRAGYVRPTDYDMVLRTHEGYGVGEIGLQASHWLVGRTLREAELTRWGVLVLGIVRRGGGYIASPTSRTTVEAGDELTLYGPVAMIEALASVAEPGAPAGAATSADADATVVR